MAVVIGRFDVVLVELDPTVGSEIQKTRPSLVISPDEMNNHLQTIVVAPMATGGKHYPSRIACRFRAKNGMVLLDQIRTVDRLRIVKRLGRLDPPTCRIVADRLQQMFAY